MKKTYEEPVAIVRNYSLPISGVVMTSDPVVDSTGNLEDAENVNLFG